MQNLIDCSSGGSLKFKIKYSVTVFIILIFFYKSNMLDMYDYILSCVLKIFFYIGSIYFFLLLRTNYIFILFSYFFYTKFENRLCIY